MSTSADLSRFRHDRPFYALIGRTFFNFTPIGRHRGWFLNKFKRRLWWISFKTHSFVTQNEAKTPYVCWGKISNFPLHLWRFKVKIIIQTCVLSPKLYMYVAYKSHFVQLWRLVRKSQNRWFSKKSKGGTSWILLKNQWIWDFRSSQKPRNRCFSSKIQRGRKITFYYYIRNFPIYLT